MGGIQVFPRPVRLFKLRFKAVYEARPTFQARLQEVRDALCISGGLPKFFPNLVRVLPYVLAFADWEMEASRLVLDAGCDVWIFGLPTRIAFADRVLVPDAVFSFTTPNSLPRLSAFELYNGRRTARVESQLSAYLAALDSEAKQTSHERDAVTK